MSATGGLRDAPQAAQLIGDDLLLKLGLARIGDVLPLTAAARLRAEVGAGRHNAVRAGIQHLQQPRPRPTLPLLDDLDPHALAGDGIRHKDGFPCVPTDRLTTVSDRVQVNFDGLLHVCALLRDR